VQCPARLRQVSASVIYCHRLALFLFALLAVAPGGRLLLEKFKYLGSDGKNATLSIAERMEE